MCRKCVERNMFFSVADDIGLENWHDYTVFHCNDKWQLSIATYVLFQTSCRLAGGRHDIPPPLSSLYGRRSASRRRTDRNVAAVSHGQYVPTITAAADALTWRWVKRPGDLDLWPFDLESGVPVTCDVGYLCAKFGLPRPLCSRVIPDVRDRQTSDVKQTSDKSIA